jgi:hypothetical protein
LGIDAAVCQDRPMSTIVSRAVQAPVLRAVDRVRERRYMRRLKPIVERYVLANGLTVSGGPFAGLEYLPEVQQVPKLAGTYELELHPAVAQWIADRPALIVDVGCAEGYYAVGLARAIPGAQVHAYDIDEGWRRRCARLADRNDVGDRVRVRGQCTLADLRALPTEGVALFLDCEGCELELLRPDAVPAMTGWSILVELHDFLRPGLTDEIVHRFEATHEIELIVQQGRDGLDRPELEVLDARSRAIALDEYRPEAMRWANLRPRASAPED